MLVEWSDRAQAFAFASKRLLSILVKFGRHRSTLDRLRVFFSPNLMLFLELCEEIIITSRIPLKIASKPTKRGVGWSDRAETFVYTSKCVPKDPGKVWAPSDHYESS